MEFQSFIKAIEAEFEEIKPGTLNGDTVMSDMLSWNSLNALIIMTIIKEQFNIELEAEEFDASLTLTELFRSIQAKGVSK